MTSPAVGSVQTPTSAASAEPTAGQRLMSVDALRGFDMFWIIGAGAIVEALHDMTPNPVVSFFAGQLEHVEWAGFHFYDLIFPLFVFLVGVSLVFSLTKAVAREGRAGALKRVFRRTVLLFVVALLYSGGFSNTWPGIRLLGVLNRIALAYFFAALLYCYFKPRALAGICVGLLVGYWALMTFVPIRDIQLTKPAMAELAEKAGDPVLAAQFRDERNLSTIKDSPAWAAAGKMFAATTHRIRGSYEPGLNLSDHFDFQYLPGKKWDTFYDPEGYLSTIPAIATCLLGVFAGLLLRNTEINDAKKAGLLLGCGAAAILVGCLWSLQFPVIKKIWSSSFVLVAGGCSAILLGVFYQVVDVWQKRTWCQPFVWMGMNSITIYLASNLLGGFRRVAVRFTGGDVEHFLDAHVAKGAGSMVTACVGLLLAFWLVYFLHKRKIYLRL